MNNNNYNNGNLINYNSINNNININNNYINRNNNNININNNNSNNNNNFNAKTTIEKSSNDIELNFMIKTRGLANVGATCYMNATLQCFYHVKALSENLINDDQITSGMELTKCYKDLVEELTGIKNHNKRKFKIDLDNCIEDKNSKDYVEPKKFKELISKKNPLFKGVKANDSKDLIIFLLEGMDNELTKRNNKSSKKEIFFEKYENDLRDEKFKKTHNSIFAQLFYGFQKTPMKCLSCNFVDENYSLFNFLIFPLEKIYNSLNQNTTNNNIKYNNYMNINYGYRGNESNDICQLNYPTYINPSKRIYINNERKLKLDDCFKEYQKIEQLFGDNQIYCNKCNKYSNATTCNQIYIAPNVLILIINRGKGNYFKCDLEFPHQLNISNYVLNRNSPKFYNLIGVISHLGESSMEGHFIAYCKHFDDNWYLFNDGIVSTVSENDIYKGTPYILFYQNKNIK